MRRLFMVAMLPTVTLALCAQLYNAGPGFIYKGEGICNSSIYEGKTPDGQKHVKEVTINAVGGIFLAVYEELGDAYDDTYVAAASMFADGSILHCFSSIACVDGAFLECDFSLKFITLSSCYNANLRKSWVRAVYLLSLFSGIDNSSFGCKKVSISFIRKGIKGSNSVYLVDKGEYIEIRRLGDDELLKTVK